MQLGILTLFGIRCVFNFISVQNKSGLIGWLGMGELSVKVA